MKTTHTIILTEDYIAEAQRLSIAQNKTLKWMYQSWWLQWLARAFMVGFIIYALMNHMESSAALFGVFLAISFYGEWFGKRSLARARSKVRAKGTTTVVCMNEQGVDLDGALGNSHLKWLAMLQPAIYPHGVLLLAQYVGRLHREHDGKREVVVYDYVDRAVPVLARMAAKREKGYKALGYALET
jgi:hypothetical protein